MRLHGIECHDIHWEELLDPVGRKTGLAEFHCQMVLFHWWGNDPLQEWIASLLDSRVNYKPSFVCILHRHGVRAPYHYDRYVLVYHDPVQSGETVPCSAVSRIFPTE